MRELAARYASFEINSVSPLRGGTAAHEERKGKGERGDVVKRGQRKRGERWRDEEEKGERWRGAETQANPPCGSLPPFFIGDLCFIRLSERKTHFPSSPQ